MQVLTVSLAFSSAAVLHLETGEVGIGFLDLDEGHLHVKIQLSVLPIQHIHRGCMPSIALEAPFALQI